MIDIGFLKKKKIPKSPGCYLFLNSKKQIIYVGKASVLKNRVFSYWQKSAQHSPAKYSMMKQIADIKIIPTDTEIEALLLESNLIKKHQPHYNVLLRDDKRFVYIKISTEDEFPRIFMTRKLDKQGLYFGPFVSTSAVKETLKAVRKIWSFRTCANLPQKACLYYRIGKCPGMCEGKISKKEYAKIIKEIILFFNGKKNQIIKKMEKDLEKASEEEASAIKYRIVNLNKVLDNVKILSQADKFVNDVVELAKVLGLKKVPKRIEAYDISNLFGKNNVASMVVFENGEAKKSDYRKFKIKNEKGGDTAMLREVFERRLKYLQEKSKTKSFSARPDLIIIDGGRAQLNVLLRVLKKMNLNINCLAVSKGMGLRGANAPDKVFFPGQKTPLQLPLSSPALHIIKRARDEAHRFALAYHKNLRKRW